MAVAVVGPVSLIPGWQNTQPGTMALAWQNAVLPVVPPDSHLPLIGECADQVITGRVSLPPPQQFFAPGDP